MQQDVLPAQVDAIRLELRLLGMHVRHVTLRPPYLISSAQAYELHHRFRQGSRQFTQQMGALRQMVQL
ncbi:hypothetical protein GCM10018965_065690 [Nonomuraea roseola]